MNLNSRPISEALVHGFRVLQAFTASESAFHLVQTLVLLGYIERIPHSKQFRLTLKPLELGFHAIVQNPESFSCCGGIDNDPRDLNRCSLSELFENDRSLTERLDKSK
jgi:hypothetical protein